MSPNVVSAITMIIPLNVYNSMLFFYAEKTPVKVYPPQDNPYIYNRS